jgi:hypothetical protein
VRWLNRWVFNWYNWWPTCGSVRIKGIHYVKKEFNMNHAICPPTEYLWPCDPLCDILDPVEI